MAKSALVTGASTGIGLELCRVLAKNGYALYITARSAGKLAAVAEEMRQAGSPEVTTVPLDLAIHDGARQLVDALNGIVPDVLVNNAGFGMLGRFDQIELSVQMEMIQLNVTTLVELTRRLLPAMVARNSGRVLNVASTAAFQPGPLMAIYYATKAFVLHFSEAIAEELNATGVTVTVLCPGPTETEFMARAKVGELKLFKGGGMKIMSAKEVAEIGYRAMMEGKVLTIAGLRNRLGMEALRLAPRSVVRKMVKQLQSSAS